MLRKYFKICLFSISILIFTNPSTAYADNDLVDQNSCSFLMSKRLVELLSEREAFLSTFKEGKFVYEAGNIKRATEASKIFFSGSKVSEFDVALCIFTGGLWCAGLPVIHLGIPAGIMAAMPLWAIMDAINNGTGFAYNKIKKYQQNRFNTKMDLVLNQELQDGKKITKFLNEVTKALTTDNDAQEIINIAKMYSIISDAKDTRFRMDGKDFNQVVDQNLILPSKWKSPIDRREKILQVKEIIRDLDAQGELCAVPWTKQLEPSIYFQAVKRKFEAISIKN